MALEINLVPDIKNEMIKTLKLRNLIFFICIIVASASIAITVVFGLIVGGQQLAINRKVDTHKTLSTKLNSYSDRDDFLTIKDQLSNISSLTANKKVASRTFNILSALIPLGSLDSIEISELRINFAEASPTLTFDAQANAGQPPYIDYNVLDSFKKSMQYMRYDYGNYVDRYNNPIPAYCMIERNSDGAHFSEPQKGKYAYWTILKEGCNQIDKEALEGLEYDDDGNIKVAENQNNLDGYSLENYDGTSVVKIWRTPQVEWYKSQAKEDEPQMNENGEIKNIPHFNSECINYQLVIKNNAVSKIDDSDNSCFLVPGDTDDDRMVISESSNGRDSSEQLVLRFSATITLASDVYDFNKFHMLALGPSERRNVTDSYVQLQTIFGERAKDCQEGDADCKTNGGN